MKLPPTGPCIHHKLSTSMKFVKSLFFLLVVGLTVQSCDSFEETNTDPSRPTDVPLNLILPAMQTQAAYNQSANPARLAGIVMQYYIGFDAQQVAYTKYTIGADVFNNYWRFGLYAGSLKDAEVIIAKAQEQDAPYYEGIAEIIQGMEFLEAASQFGDIPYTEALMGAENFQPGFTPMLEVYAGAMAQIDRGIALLSGDAGTIQPGGDDLIFGGDASLWVKTGNALKARYLMHLINRDAGNASKALDAIGNAFESAAEQPDFAYGSSQTDNNPLAKFGNERPNTLIVQDASTNQGSFGTALQDRNDPRTIKYVEEALDEDGNGTGFFTYFNSANPDLIWAQNTSVIPYISYVELKFLEAEALERTGGDGTDALKEAINASLALNGITDAEDFAENQVGDDTDIEEIITEAYYAYYGIAHLQSWTNYRRTGFPNITPVSDFDTSFDPSGIIPERWLYPVSEINLNSANVQAAIDRQGGNLLDDELAAFAD